MPVPNAAPLILELSAQVGGIPTAEMNSLELEFLFMINFTLNVTPEVYRQYEHELMMRTLFIYRSESLECA